MVYDQSFTVATVKRSLAPVDRNGEIVRHSTSSLIKRDVIVCSLSFVQQAHIIRKKQRIITLQTDHIQIRSKQNRERNDQINLIYKKSFVQQVNSHVWSTEISLKLGPFEKWLVTEFQVRIFGARNANSAYFAKLC